MLHHRKDTATINVKRDNSNISVFTEVYHVECWLYGKGDGSQAQLPLMRVCYAPARQLAQ